MKVRCAYCRRFLAAVQVVKRGDHYWCRDCGRATYPDATDLEEARFGSYER